MIKPFYLKSIDELSVKKRTGWNTRKGVPRNHVYKVSINGKSYFKFHVKRDNKSYIKYFKLKREAQEFVSLVRKHKSIENAMGVLF